MPYWDDALREVMGHIISDAFDLLLGRRTTEPSRAERLFEHFCAACRNHGVTVATGRFWTSDNLCKVG